MINYSKYLISKGIIKPPFYYNILLGNIACAQATPLSIGLLSSELPQDSIWCLAGIGNFQLRSNVMGIMFVHGVRIGMEDNFWYDEERTKLATNYELVKRIVDIAHNLEKDIYSAKEVRSLLNL